jgi:hypothetical protein
MNHTRIVTLIPTRRIHRLTPHPLPRCHVDETTRIRQPSSIPTRIRIYHGRVTHLRLSTPAVRVHARALRRTRGGIWGADKYADDEARRYDLACVYAEGGSGSVRYERWERDAVSLC